MPSNSSVSWLPETWWSIRIRFASRWQSLVACSLQSMRISTRMVLPSSPSSVNLPTGNSVRKLGRALESELARLRLEVRIGRGGARYRQGERGEHAE
jgi:hypothetical protein